MRRAGERWQQSRAQVGQPDNLGYRQVGGALQPHHPGPRDTGGAGQAQHQELRYLQQAAQASLEAAGTELAEQRAARKELASDPRMKNLDAPTPGLA